MDRERVSRPIALAIVALPALVRVLHYDLQRIHGDDVLTASFSAALSWTGNPFAPVPADPNEWVAQFPAPFFHLQKAFFAVCGESLLAVKLSVLPYVLAVSASLFLIARELCDDRAAILAVVLYAFFGPSLYLETLGLHFVSSTAVFLAFFYFALVERRTGEPRHAILAGLLAGACYLFYLSSFIALPIGALFFLGRGRGGRRNAALFVAAAAIVIAPFLVEAMRHDDYFLARFRQVALLRGEWSPFRKVGPSGWPKVLRGSLWWSARSLWSEGIGGHGGYEFGRQALFEPVVGLLVAAGLPRAFTLGRTRREWWIVLAAVAASFVFGMVLTDPPPAFHRLSLAFPLLALLAAMPMHALLTWRGASRAFRTTVVAAVLAAAVIDGDLYFRRAAIDETPHPALRLARFVDALFPDRPLYVAAFPSYAFAKIYRLASAGRAGGVRSAYHADLLRALDPSRPYVYVVTLPRDFDAAFSARDPGGRLIRFSEEFSVFAN